VAVLAVAALGVVSVVPAADAHRPPTVPAAVPVTMPADAAVAPAPEPAPPVDADLAPAPPAVPVRERLAREIVGPDWPDDRVLGEALGRLGAVSLLAGGPRPTRRSLATVAEALGVTLCGIALDPAAWAEQVEVTRRQARPLLVTAGLDVPDVVRLRDLAAAMQAHDIDPGRRVDPADVEALRAAVRADLAELREVTAVEVDAATDDGLATLLAALGVDFGRVVDPPDVAAGRARAATLLLAAEEARAAAEAAARAEEAAAAGPVGAPESLEVPPPPPPAPTAAAPPDPPPPPPPAWRPVHGSLVHRTFTLPGPVEVQVLRWRLDDPRLRLRADYAVGPGGRGTVPDAAARTGAVAAVNGGFWVGENDPDGLLVRDGFLLSDTTANTDGHRNIRSAFGVRDGKGVVGVPRWNARVELGDTSVGVWGVNRPPYEPGQVLLATPGAGPDPIGATTGTALRVPRVDLNRSGAHELEVLERRNGGSLRVTDDTMVVWVSPEAAAVPRGLDRVTLRVSMDPAWERTETALAAGPWLLTRGEGVGVAQWRQEGFDSAHTDRLHPRSALGFTAEGHGVIVAVDGRRPGRSEGMTHTEVARFLQGLGVRDAVMLDGGGSTQMVVQGRVVNTPCCDQPLRRVSTVVTLLPR
jgi:hypothetical protein